MTPEQQSRLLELFAAFSQETLTETEHVELQAALHADQDARRLWFLHQDLELGLKRLTQVVTATADQSVEVESDRVEHTRADTGSGLASLQSDTGSGRDLPLKKRHLAVTTVAVLCMLAIVIFSFQIGTRPPDSSLAIGDKIASNRVDELIIESPTHGTTLTLPDQKGKLIALHFLLKTECPFCLKLAHDYSQIAASNPAVLHLFLKPDSAEEIKVWAGKISPANLNGPPVIYRDPDARLAKEFGIPDGYKFHGQTVHYPALVLLDGAGQELFRYVGKDHADRMQPDDFIARLAMVTEHR